MTNTSPRTDVRQLLTEDIDAQIAELRAKKQKLTAAGRALVAAADEVDARRAAVADAQSAFNARRQDLIELGMKPRAISRLLKGLRAEGAGVSQETNSAEHAADEHSNPSVEVATHPTSEGQETSPVRSGGDTSVYQ
ncbi:hypothetical protein FOV72_19590 [Gordonia rubripertincta]|uniref:hypothetical protein n=1 Tax=Gordonia rubripertincta TaxID=36822 RepID=UPI00117F11B3|nr:hypothetical protein [Gordonia rubripertincta]TSD93465.1 hypothetical protein FOV72_19590 [Gordonia rubripertincta]